MRIVDFDPSEGVARQGDVIIAELPEGLRVTRERRLTVNRDGRVTLAEGELTGHHHSILARAYDPPRFRDDAMAFAALKEGEKIAPAMLQSHASLYRDDKLLAQMQSVGLLRTTHLAQGFLVVEGGAAVLEHQEHDAIRIPPGEYYVGRQETIDPKSGALSRVMD